MRKANQMIATALVICFLFSLNGCQKKETHHNETNISKKEQIDLDYQSMRDSDTEFLEINEFAPQNEYAGIKAITYKVLNKVKIFAYYAEPENICENTPAVILVHGGGGHAYLEWVKKWQENGYVVIAPDITGYFPTRVNAGDSVSSDGWERTLKGVFEEEGVNTMLDNDGFSHSNEPLEKQWMYQVLLALTGASNILERNENGSKIGIIGISWGAVVSTIYAEYDDRLDFLIPIYGSGCLSESYSYMGEIFSSPETQELWGDDRDLSKIKCPVYWICSNYDENFSVNSNSDSFLETKENPFTRLAILDKFSHSHESAWKRKEPFIFANEIVSGESIIPLFIEYPTNNDISCTVENGSRAFLYYLTKELRYDYRESDTSGYMFPTEKWSRIALTINDGQITGDIPDEAVCYYVSVAGNGCTVTTPIYNIEK